MQVKKIQNKKVCVVREHSRLCTSERIVTYGKWHWDTRVDKNKYDTEPKGWKHHVNSPKSLEVYSLKYANFLENFSYFTLSYHV